MASRIVNSLALLASLVVALGFAGGVLPRADAFFLAGAILVVLSGYHLTARAGTGLAPALVGMVARPQTYPRRTAYLAYVGTLALSVGVMVLSLVHA